MDAHPSAVLRPGPVGGVTFDVQAFRKHFPVAPSPASRTSTGPAGPRHRASVADAVAATLCGPLSNRGTADGVASATPTRRSPSFRQAMADLLDADPRGIVYGRSATQLTYDFSRHLAKTWSPGDEIVLSTLDHDANIRPWVQAAERAGVDRPLVGVRPGDAPSSRSPISSLC